jgi:fluoride exporter
MNTLAVALGGMFGSVARYWLGVAVQGATGSIFPFGILVVNVLGCFVLGFLSTSLPSRGVAEAPMFFLTVDLCGGFTTMSTFSFDTVKLLQSGYPGLAMLNVGVTIAACLAAIWIGHLAGAGN